MNIESNTSAPGIREILEPIQDRHNLFKETYLARFSPQDTLFNEGDPLDQLIYIESGLIKLITYLPNGRSRIVRLHGKGSLIGVGGVVEDHHEHTAVAVSEVTVYRWPLAAFNSMRNEEPEIYGKLLEHCHQYLKLADTWITQFSTGTISSRAARLIRFLADIEATDKSNHVALLKSEEMGAVLGVAPESVSRFIADFKRRGILTPVKGVSEEIYSADLDALDRIAKEE